MRRRTRDSLWIPPGVCREMRALLLASVEVEEQDRPKAQKRDNRSAIGEHFERCDRCANAFGFPRL